MTQKEQLEAAEAKIKDLEPKAYAAANLQTKLDEANTNLQTTETARAAAVTRAEKAEADLSAAISRAEAAEGETNTQKGKVADLEKNSKTADEKARENNARMGLNTQQKSDASITGASEDIEAVAEQFTNPKTSMSEKAALLKKHGSALATYAANIPNRG